jgi:hypothetical protein
MKPKSRVRKKHMTKAQLRYRKTAITCYHMSRFLETHNTEHEHQAEKMRRDIRRLEFERVRRVKSLSNFPDPIDTAEAGSCLFRSYSRFCLESCQLSTSDISQLRNDDGIRMRTKHPVYVRYTWVQRAVIVFTHPHHLLANSNFEHTILLTGVKRSRA